MTVSEELDQFEKDLATSFSQFLHTDGSGYTPMSVPLIASQMMRLRVERILQLAERERDEKESN